MKWGKIYYQNHDKKKVWNLSYNMALLCVIMPILDQSRHCLKDCRVAFLSTPPLTRNKQGLIKVSYLMGVLLCVLDKVKAKWCG